MNLNELREAMASDATKENEELKRDLASLKERYHKDTAYLRSYCNAQLEDLKALANRCWTLTHGAMCCFCVLDAFKCPHDMNCKQKIEAAKKMMEESNNAEN